MEDFTNTPTGRGGYPSASGMERIALCPGSLLAERSVPYEEVESEAAREGTLIHSVLAGTAPESELTSDQLWVVDRCRAIETNLLERFAIDAVDLVRERRIWHDLGYDQLFSGQADLIALTASQLAMVIDYKTGRGSVTPAERNYQMRSLAVLAARKYGLSRVFVALIHPRVMAEDTGDCFTVADYSLEDLFASEIELADILVEAQKLDAPRKPGTKQCQYCRAKVQCPEARSHALNIVPLTITPGMKPKDVRAALPVIAAEEAADLYDKAVLAGMVVTAIKEQFKARLDAGEELPGLGLKEGTKQRKIADPQVAFDRLSDIMDSQTFLTCVTVSASKLQDALAAETGLKPAEAKEQLRELLGDAMSEESNEPSLARVTSNPAKVAA